MIKSNKNCFESKCEPLRTDFYFVALFFVPVSSLGGSGGSMTNFRGKYIQYIPSAH